MEALTSLTRIFTITVKTWDPSQHCYSISPSNKWPSRNIEQINQKYSAKDGQRDGNSMEG
jgi:hypothetical protein